MESIKRNSFSSLVIIIGLISLSYSQESFNNHLTFGETDILKIIVNQEKDSILRHSVIFSFKENTTKGQLTEIEKTFNGLPQKINEIFDYEWGLNTSKDSLLKGFTHCYLVSFKTEEDLRIYEEHPDHLLFVKLVSEHVEEVFVVDYWIK